MLPGHVLLYPVWGSPGLVCPGADDSPVVSIHCFFQKSSASQTGARYAVVHGSADSSDLLPTACGCGHLLSDIGTVLRGGAGSVECVEGAKDGVPEGIETEREGQNALLVDIVFKV